MPSFEGDVRLAPGASIRLDRYLALTGILTRSQLKARNAAAFVNGKTRKLSFSVQKNDHIIVEWYDNRENIIHPEIISLNVLFEDQRIIVVDKRQGMVVHPAAGNWSGTLVNALMGRRSGGAAAFPGGRPFVVHRLDKDTSGVIIAAWDAEALEFLQAQFRARTVGKRYLAIVRGSPKNDAGIIDAPLARDRRERKRFAVTERGKAARTKYKALRRFAINGALYALLLLAPKTGRTHQIRVHLKHIGCPILGDPIYGSRDERFPRATLMLHARKLSVVLPGKHEPSTFTAGLPRHFREILSGLNNFSRL